MSTGLRVKKKNATRQQIVEQAFSLFIAQGFEKVTVDQIAAAAGISRRSFFRYFPSKEWVVFPTHDEKLALLTSQLAKFQSQHSPMQAIRLALIEMAKYFESTRTHVLQQHQVIQHSAQLVRFEKQIDLDWADCVATFLTEQLPAEFDQFKASIFANALIAGVRVAYQQWIEQGCNTGDFEQSGELVFNTLSSFKLN